MTVATRQPRPLTATVTVLVCAFASTSVPRVAHGADPETGVEALCREVAGSVASRVGTEPFRLEVGAEGHAIEVADAVQSRCSAVIGAKPGQRTHQTEEPRSLVRLRLRATADRLLALVEVLDPASRDVHHAEAVDVPAGKALAAWFAAAGAAFETWRIGSVDGEVLALCGADADGEGRPELALVQRDRIVFARWTLGGLETIRVVPLEPGLRFRARAPWAHADCEAVGPQLRTRLYSPETGATVRYLLEAGDVRQDEAAPANPSAAVTNVPGTGLVRWKDRLLAAFALGAEGTFVGVTQEGALVTDAGLTRPRVSGAGIALVDLDGDGSIELVRTRAVLPDDEATDRLMVSAPHDPDAIRHESVPVRGVLGAVGVVRTSAWTRVAAVRFDGVKSVVFAFGLRRPGEAP